MKVLLLLLLLMMMMTMMMMMMMMMISLTNMNTVSMLFKWYHNDFGRTDAEMLQYIKQFLSPSTVLDPTYKVLCLYVYI